MIRQAESSHVGERLLRKGCTMRTITKPFFTLSAGDLMNPEVIRLQEMMPLREAAHLLLQHQVGGAPVVDTEGRCVGVLSAVDFVRLAEKEDVARPTAPLPLTCQFQVRFRRADGQEVILCTLPLGACPLQETRKGPEDKPIVVCSQPHAVVTTWQVIEVEKLPADEVGQYMTADPVTVTLDTPIGSLARMMIDAHIHRVIVVDEQRRPVGVVSTSDIMAAVAHADSVQQADRGACH
jgi:CBS domain-containing protein